jgi:protein-tyrosine phosphatase
MDTNPHLTERRLDWAACYNVRDLGGLATQDGGQTAWRAVVRSDHPGRLTSAGRQALIEYGVRTIIDLRAPHEAQKEPYVFSHPDAPVYLNLPLESFVPQVSALISRAANRAEVYGIILDHYPHLMADVMRALADARPGGVMIHCHNGKDRTGMVVALLLCLAGVPEPTIVADYAESQVSLRPLYQATAAQAGSTDYLGFWHRPTATPDMMQAMLAHLAAAYGGVRPYLKAAGLSVNEMERLVNRLRSG